MEIETTKIPGVLLLKPRVFVDARGFFMEIWTKASYAQAGLPYSFLQDNISRSMRGCLRGLHFQRRYPQGKLLQAIRGRIWDVAVDLRHESPTFGQWHAEELSDENHCQLYIPPGLAHGFCVLSDQADVLYKCTQYYKPGDEGAIRWNDPDLAINWPVTEPMLSAKDAAAPFLTEQTF